MAMTSLLGVYNCLQAFVKPSAPLETQNPLDIHRKHSLPCLEYPRHGSGILSVVYTKIRQHSPIPARKDCRVGLVQQGGAWQSPRVTKKGRVEIVSFMQCKSSSMPLFPRFKPSSAPRTPSSLQSYTSQPPAGPLPPRSCHRCLFRQ